MKINFNNKILDFDNEIIEVNKKPLLLSQVCVDALLGSYKDEEKLTGEQKYTRFKLAEKIKDSKEDLIELKSEEITEIKKLIAKRFTTLVIGRAYDLLEDNK